MKVCSKCKINKINCEFSPAKENVGGLNSWCKSCHREYQHEYRKTRKSKESKDRFMENVGGNAGYYRKYKSTIRRVQKRYEQTKHGKLNHRIQQIKYKARKMNAVGEFTASQWKKVLNYYSPTGVCICCGKADKQIVPDHIIPLSKGGSNLITNIQPLCSSCNCGKRDWNSNDYRFDNGIYAQQWLEK